MREVLQLQIGQCGNQIGQQFWKKLIDEHSIDSDGNFIGNDPHLLQYATIERYVPRCLIIDTDSSTIDNIIRGELGNLFDPNSINFEDYDTEHLFTNANFRFLNNLCHNIRENIRKEVETCDCFESFQILCSTGGGCSGVMNCVLQILREDYVERVTECDIVLPSTKEYQNNPLEIYNSTLCFNNIVYYTDFNIFMDNEALYEICFKHKKIKDPTFDDFNNVVSDMLVHKSSILRFPGRPNYDNRFVGHCLRPDPMIKYFYSSHVLDLSENNYEETIKSLHDQSNCMLSMDTKNETNFSSMVISRGEISSFDFDDKIIEFRNSTGYIRDQRIPEHCKIIECSPSPGENKSRIMMLSNSTAVINCLQKLEDAVNSLYSKRSFIHLYFNEEDDEYELDESIRSLKDIILKYKESAGLNCDDDDDEEGEGNDEGG